MYIKIVNTKGEYKCIIMGHNDPIQVYWGKGYGVVYRLSLLQEDDLLESLGEVLYGSYSYLIMVYKELIFLFCDTKQRY